MLFSDLTKPVVNMPKTGFSSKLITLGKAQVLNTHVGSMVQWHR